MADLIAPSDTDLLAFTRPEDKPLTDRALYFLRAACESVRVYCGWHIAPSVTEVIPKLEVGSRGLIMVPSRYVTDVSSVVVDQDQTLSVTDYEWFKEGYIEMRSPVYRYGYAGFAGGTPTTTVSMTHGYITCPLPVKQVIFELMESAATAPSGSVSSVSAPGYGITWGDEGGVNIVDSHRARLSHYRIGGPR